MKERNNHVDEKYDKMFANFCGYIDRWIHNN